MIRKNILNLMLWGVNSEKEEFAVKAKDRKSGENIIRGTLCTKDSDKWFEYPIENN